VGDEWPLGGAVVLVPLLYFLDRTDMEADTSQPGAAMSIVDSVGPPAELRYLGVLHGAVGYGGVAGLTV
jgi:hypothetical protein